MKNSPTLLSFCLNNIEHQSEKEYSHLSKFGILITCIHACHENLSNGMAESYLTE